MPNLKKKNRGNPSEAY